jgi:predicted RNA binding protein with dsRBD fold (UPF0201 family)
MNGVIRVIVHPTENVEKVKLAINNIFGDIEIRESLEGYVQLLEGTINSMEELNTFRDILRRMRIRDAAYSLLQSAPTDSKISFGLNKQAAYAGKVSFHRSGSSPMGPIQVELNGKKSEIIEFLCGKMNNQNSS